jgi:hypothetical protein
MRRALQVLEGSGHQEPSSAFNGYHPYDHPYLGQILVAFMLKIANYPSSLDSMSAEASSIQMLHLIPRVFMGILAVIDTFLVYKITKLRYNRNLALAASILFAVMPMTWLLRRILLDSIFLPLVLSSIFFAVKYNVKMNINGKHYNEMSTVLLSGIFLGLAIFTKIPTITMVPLVVYLVITSISNNHNNNNSMKWRTLGIWFIPVILMPAIWPAYALLYGQFEQWVDGISWQSSRVPRSLLDTIKSVFEIDPVMTTLGILGVVWTTIRRDFFSLLWVLPYMMFLGLTGYSQYIHIALLLPSFSMVAAILVRDFSDKLRPMILYVLTEFSRMAPFKSSGEKKPTSHQLEMYMLPTPSGEPQPTGQPNQKAPKINSFLSSFPLWLFLLAVVIVFGLINTSILITTNVNSSLYEAYAAFVKYLPSGKDTNNEDGVTLITAVKWGTYFYWIPKYVFDKELAFLDEKRFFIGSKDAPSTEKIITIGGKTDKDDDEINIVLIGRMDNIARHFDYEKYPYNNMKYNELGNLDMKANY